MPNGMNETAIVSGSDQVAVGHGRASAPTTCCVTAPSGRGGTAGRGMEVTYPISTRRFNFSRAFSITRLAPSVRRNPGTRTPISTPSR